MNEFANIITEAIRKGLPGTRFQWMMASSDRMLKDFPRVPGPDARVAGVLILLWPENGTIHTVFMQRPEYLGFHGGQISFPGGKQEPSDENIIRTAFREAEEETGISTDTVEVAGMLTPLFIPVSNMIVTAIIGYTEERPLFSPNPVEVDHLIIADLDRFLDPDIIRTKPMELRGETYDIKYFAYEDYVIWGATAMILNELLEILRRDKIPLVF